MSAPWEVWLASSLPHIASYDRGGTEGAPDKFNLRYLRADLTCGECRLEADDDCPNYYLTNEGYVFPTDENPACMAFVLRVEK